MFSTLFSTFSTFSTFEMFEATKGAEVNPPLLVVAVVFCVL